MGNSHGKEFEITDTSPPPASSIAYSDCGAQTIATYCLVIPSSGGFGHTRGRASAPESNVVYRMNASKEKLDDVIFNRASPGILPEVQNDMTAIAKLIGSDPWKTLKETVPDGNGSRRAYFEKIKSFLENCKETEDETPGGMTRLPCRLQL